MKPLALSWIALALGWGGTEPAAAEALRLAQPNAARFPEITLYAHPVDSLGRMQRGLDPAGFRVFEDGASAPVLRVEASGGAIDVCLALDRGMSMREGRKLEFARAAAQEFIGQLGPSDRAALINFADGSTLEQPLVRDRSVLLGAVGRAQATGKTTAFRDAVYWSIAQVALHPERTSVVAAPAAARADARRVVVALTDGQDLSSKVYTYQLVDYARANGVSLCMVALGKDAAVEELQHLARQTGGIYLHSPAPRDLKRLYVDLADQLRHEYRLSIRSPRPAADATRRALRVEHASLSGNTWYQAPGAGSLLVTVPLEAAPPGPGVAGSAAPAGGSPPAMDGVLLAGGIVLGLLALGTGLLFGLRALRGGLLIADSNPRIDLLPLTVRQGCTRIGRDVDCDVILHGIKVSRLHAIIETAHGDFRITDQGSTNGTYVNGRRIHRTHRIRVGDILRFGDNEYRFDGYAA